MRSAPRRVLVPLLLAAVSGPVTGLAAQVTDTRVLTLEEAETLALRRNPAVLAAGAGLGASEAKRAQARHARFFPEMTLRNIWGPVPRARGEFTETGVLVSPDTSTDISDLRFFTQVELEFVQPLTTGGRLSGLIGAADAGVAAAEAELRTSREEVRLRVRKAYWGLVLGLELLEVAEDVVGEAEEAGQKMEEKFEEGSEQVTQNDMFKFRVFRYEVDKRHREARDRVELARAALRVAVGLPEELRVEPADSLLTPVDVELGPLLDYLAIARRNRPELRRLRAGIEARSSMVEVEESAFEPQLFLGADITLNRAPGRFDPDNPFLFNPTNFFNPGLVLGFNWNPNFVQTRDRVRVARHERNRLAATEPLLISRIELEVRERYGEVRRAEVNIRESRRALRASDNWLRAASQTFDIGVGEVQDVIDAFRANAEMRAEHMRTIFAYNTSLAELSRAVGRDLYPE